jgi:hypothetical protein
VPLPLAPGLVTVPNTKRYRTASFVLADSPGSVWHRTLPAQRAHCASTYGIKSQVSQRHSMRIFVPRFSHVLNFGFKLVRNFVCQVWSSWVSKSLYSALGPGLSCWGSSNNACLIVGILTSLCQTERLGHYGNPAFEFPGLKNLGNHPEIHHLTPTHLKNGNYLK